MLKSLKTHGNDDENITKSIRFICLREIKKTWAKGVTEIQKLQSQVQRFNDLTKNNGKLETTVAYLQKEMVRHWKCKKKKEKEIKSVCSIFRNS